MLRFSRAGVLGLIVDLCELEVLPNQRSEVVSSKYVMQYCFGAAATGAIVPLIDAVGVGWTFSISMYRLRLSNVICTS